MIVCAIASAVWVSNLALGVHLVRGNTRSREPCVAIEEVNGRSCVVYAERNRRIARDGHIRGRRENSVPLYLVDSRLTAKTKPFQDVPLERKRHRARHARPELGRDASVSGDRREISLAVTRGRPPSCSDGLLHEVQHPLGSLPRGWLGGTPDSG